MKKSISVLLTAIFLFAAGGLIAGDISYQGSKKCIMCHKKKNAEHVTAMKAHKHFYAFDVLKADEKTKAECVVCHTTGFGNGGYEIKDAAFWSPAADDKAGIKAQKKMADLQYVGCESCHTDLTNSANFKAHKKKNKETGEYGYKPVHNTAETCKACHNEKSPTFKPLNFEEEIKKLK